MSDGVCEGRGEGGGGGEYEGRALKGVEERVLGWGGVGWGGMAGVDRFGRLDSKLAREGAFANAGQMDRCRNFPLRTKHPMRCRHIIIANPAY